MSDEQANPIHQLSDDLNYIDGVLNVGLGAGLARGDVNRVQVAEAHNVFNRIIENCKQLAQDNMRLTAEAAKPPAVDERTQQRINELEAEVGQLRIFKKRAEASAEPPEAKTKRKPKSKPKG